MLSLFNTSSCPHIKLSMPLPPLAVRSAHSKSHPPPPPSQPIHLLRFEIRNLLHFFSASSKMLPRALKAFQNPLSTRRSADPFFFRGPVPRPKRWLAAAAASRASKEAPQRGPERSSRSHFPQGRPRTLSERSAPSHHPGESAFLPCSNGARTTARCGLHDVAPVVSL